MRQFFLYLFACFCFLTDPFPGQAAIVASVQDGASFMLASGETVRLSGIFAPYAPEPGRPGEPLGTEAKEALGRLLQNQDIRLAAASAPDRHERVLAEAYRADGLWIQAELVRQGWAMVYPFKDEDPALIRPLLAFEAQAREHGLGIWATPFFRVITPDETASFLNRFKLVEGRVVSIHPSRGHLYLNFYDRWKGRFAVFVPEKYLDRFGPGFLEGLAGKTILIRGWIHDHHAPMIDLVDPLQLTVTGNGTTTH
jgi:endonuclease YncB( thermonuclease family)